MRRVVSKITSSGCVDLEPVTDLQRDSFNEMLRTRCPPGLAGTDSINFRGKYNGNPFAGVPIPMQKVLAAQAKAMGISTTGMTYNPTLVRKEYAGRFDPEALVGSTGDVKRVLDSHPEWDAEGMVNQKGREPETLDIDETWGVDDRLVEEEVVEDFKAQGINQVSQREFADAKEKKHQQLKGDM